MRKFVINTLAGVILSLPAFVSGCLPGHGHGCPSCNAGEPPKLAYEVTAKAFSYGEGGHVMANFLCSTPEKANELVDLLKSLSGPVVAKKKLPPDTALVRADTLGQVTLRLPQVTISACPCACPCSTGAACTCTVCQCVNCPGLQARWVKENDGTGDYSWREGTELKGLLVAATGLYYPYNGSGYDKPKRLPAAVKARTILGYRQQCNGGTCSMVPVYSD